ncbi:MAG: SusD/RagB family nutrient-binding outer membrane lipoprotein, partial [Bacteroidota bacterium]
CTACRTALRPARHAGRERGAATDIAAGGGGGGATQGDDIALQKGASELPINDQFYKGDATRWITLANTLKLRLYNNTRLVDINASEKIKTLLDAGDLLDENTEDFQFEYGQQRNNPNSRHPFYNAAYETDSPPYLNNYFMWLLAEEKQDGNGATIIDPRLRFYFYRQTRGDDQESINGFCFLASPDQKPQHYLDVDARMPFCSLGNGYYGRDHGNGTGVPPDQSFRTAYGLYPGGGKFDEDSFSSILNSGTDGALGQGINPIMLASFVDFMRAEAALTLNTGEDARALLEKGMRKSIEKVNSFAPLDGIIPNCKIENLMVVKLCPFDVFVADEEDIDRYVNVVLSKFDNANTLDERLDIIMKEYFIALWGNGLEAYNNYRRTCMPLQIQPHVEPAPGVYPRSLLYPSDHVNLNASVQQKNNRGQAVFWDTNPSSCTY